MTHSGHRYGSREELQNDFVLFVRPCAKYDNASDEDRERTLKEIDYLANTVRKCGAVNIGRTHPGSISQGLKFEDIMSVKAMNGFMSVFTDKQQVSQALSEIKKRDAGISTVVSGSMEDIFEICRDNDLQPHTIHCSLGIHGKKEKLPSEDHLKIMTLCGHGLITKAMIDRYLDEIREGKLTVEAAAAKIAKPCPCGIFNVPKTIEVLKKMI